MNNKLINSLLIMTMILLSACSMPGGEGAPTEITLEAVYTAAAQTLEAQFTQTAAAQPTATSTDTPEPTPAPPTETPTSNFTPTNTLTPEPTVPMVSITIGSNCRLGPSTDYNPPVAVLGEGQKAEIRGRNPDRSWWYIQIPGRAGQFCWIWNGNVNVQGDTSGVQVVTPPPVPVTATFTPKPDVRFDPSFNNIHTCAGEPYAIFEVDNIGKVNFESMSLKIEDVDDDEEIYSVSSDNPFLSAPDQCPEGDDTLKPDKTAWIGGDVDDGETGNDGEATITLCTEEGLKGICVTHTVDFIIP